MRVVNVERLDDGQLSAVLALCRAAETVDLVTPLSEQVLLSAQPSALSAGGHVTGTNTSSTTAPPHFLAYDGTHLAGYAHLERGFAGEGSTAEVVVDPARRRLGVGTALIHALEDAVVKDAADKDAPEPQAQVLRLWSHGHLEAARAFALRDGYVKVRELWQMRRSLLSDAGSLPAVSLPERFRTRHFVIGQDEDAWLRLNAHAFVDHPEQGRITRDDLDRRIAEPWFDARGFILIEDTRGLSPVLAASHWTKVAPAKDPKVRPTQGEVYVVGVDPAYQGLGLGRAVTLLGLAHLREQGLTEAMLFVDADNAAAIATYSRLGFVRFAVDVMHSRAVHQPVKQ